MMNDLVFDICRIIATLMGLVVGWYIIPALKAVVKAHTDENITGFINACVYAAQQLYKPEDGAIKKKYVISAVTDWLNDHKISITDDQLDILIESAVLAMKTETK